MESATNEQKELVAVEELKERFRVKQHIHDGVCSRNGWKRGRLVTEPEYQESVKSFLEAGMGGR